MPRARNYGPNKYNQQVKMIFTQHLANSTSHNIVHDIEIGTRLVLPQVLTNLIWVLLKPY